MHCACECGGCVYVLCDDAAMKQQKSKKLAALRRSKYCSICWTNPTKMLWMWSILYIHYLSFAMANAIIIFAACADDARNVRAQLAATSFMAVTAVAYTKVEQCAVHCYTWSHTWSISEASFFWFVYSLIRCCWFFVLTVDSVRSFWSVKRFFFSFWCSPAIHITRARDACHSSSLSLSFSTGVIFVLFVSSTARTRRMKNGNRIFGKRYYAHHFYWAQNYGVWQYLVLFSFLCVLLSIPFI